MGRVVVGVDGSPQSRRALEFAVEEAAFRKATLEIVYVFQTTSGPSGVWGFDADVVGSWHDSGETHDESDARRRQELRRHDEEVRLVHSQARAAVEDVITQVVPPGSDEPDLVLVPDEHPAQALVNASDGADMLVVGSRGRGGFAGLVLGSVSQQCIHHARCPVTVVRSV